ncbi:hypothetical protein BKA69DRAFT_1088626 [Paraphysoderma sedebokerense]|nr:hypothetical protein BKA69DRAFT_1088626 [Paraphysoderma sedebokerense]
MKTFVLLTLLSFVAFGAAQNVTDANPAEMISLDPPSLELKDFAATAEIKISLKAKPNNAKCTLYFEAPNLSFDKCALEYDPNNYNVAQTLKIVPLPYLTTADIAREIPINIKIWCPGYSFHNRSIGYKVKRSRLSCGTCTVFGDPHYRTFDQVQKEAIHFQGSGVYYLVQSRALTVQAFQTECVPQTTCVQKLAIRYGKTVFVIDGDSPRGSCLNKVTEFDGVTVSSSVKGAIENFAIKLSDGSTITVRIAPSPGDPRKRSFLHTTFDLAEHYMGQTNGLCGRYDGNPSNDFTGSDGTVYGQAIVFQESKDDLKNIKPTFKSTSLHKWGESWRVPNDDNIFVCGSTCRGVNQYPVSGGYSECQIPPLKEPEIIPPPIIIPPIPDGYRPINNCPVYEPKPPVEIPPSNTTYVIPPDVIDGAVRGCYEQIKLIPGCEPFADVKDYQSLCEFDIRAQMPAQVCYDTYGRNYADICSRSIVSKCQEPKPDVRQKYTEIAKQYGYGRNPCTNCPSDATCTTGGCVCKAPGHSYDHGSKKCNPPPTLPPKYYPLPAPIPQPAIVYAPPVKYEIAPVYFNKPEVKPYIPETKPPKTKPKTKPETKPGDNGYGGSPSGDKSGGSSPSSPGSTGTDGSNSRNQDRTSGNQDGSQTTLYDTQLAAASGATELVKFGVSTIVAVIALLLL